MVQCVESGGTGFGIPDVYVAYEGMTAWIELKADIEGRWPCARCVKFQSGQQAWAAQHERHGGFSFLIINYGNGILITRTTAIDQLTRRPVAAASLFMQKFDAKAILSWMRESIEREKRYAARVY